VKNYLVKSAGSSYISTVGQGCYTTGITEVSSKPIKLIFFIDFGLTSIDRGRQKFSDESKLTSIDPDEKYLTSVGQEEPMKIRSKLINFRQSGGADKSEQLNFRRLEGPRKLSKNCFKKLKSCNSDKICLKI
jgi:hypothetical protein